ncbi:DUF6247 family protein [Kribbella kalugense]|uniref:Uncharacterized protein n=1 Tax=Kribbella kalugense TaxID=2512221 RepID=A0A4R7ZTK1_9ACTN|nr:DUF6247 family protein [Kribbella kalugense]TDW18830.1 hypothetical protein EV650_5426 [Kribbella kalugense]
MTNHPQYTSGDGVHSIDPSEILHLLPVKWHEQFLGEYHGALDAAHEVWRFQQLGDVLHVWRLRAVAYAGPGFEEALQATREGRADEFVAGEEAIPGWCGRL